VKIESAGYCKICKRGKNENFHNLLQIEKGKNETFNP